jgi:hypothetical protein
MKNLDIKNAGNFIWWIGVAGLLFLAHLRIESLLYQFQQGRLIFLIDPSLRGNSGFIISNFISPIRGIILLGSLVLLLHPIIQGIYSSRLLKGHEIKPSHFLQAVVLFVTLSILFRSYGISGLTEEYANTSLAMFSRIATVRYHQRLLMPALANLLFFRGNFFYLVFSFLCAFIFIYTVRLWFHSNQISVSLWQLISLGTLSFIYFQISIPGYPDVLVGIFILLAFTFDLNTKAKLSLIVLSLASHEGSIFIWFALSLILFDLKGFLRFLAVVGIYLFFMLSINMNLSEVIVAREVGETSSLAWMIARPGWEFLGIFFGFKALWAIVIGAILFLTTQKRHLEVFHILLILAAGFSMTLLGVDTSRLFGWAFMAVLLSWKILYNAGGKWSTLIDIALIINLLIPSTNVFLIMAPGIAPGIYSAIFNMVFK